jgi:hypothetical protein
LCRARRQSHAGQRGNLKQGREGGSLMQGSEAVSLMQGKEAEPHAEQGDNLMPVREAASCRAGRAVSCRAQRCWEGKQSYAGQEGSAMEGGRQPHADQGSSLMQGRKAASWRHMEAALWRAGK